MPVYVSDEGVFHPAKESVSLVNRGVAFPDPLIPGRIVEKGMSYIYEGPCRAALFELWESNGKPTKEQVEGNPDLMTFGINFKHTPEFLQMLRDLNFKSAKEYLAWVGYDEMKAKAEVEKKKASISKHELPQRIAEIKRVGGGSDSTGSGQVQYGGFGVPAGVR